MPSSAVIAKAMTGSCPVSISAARRRPSLFGHGRPRLRRPWVDHVHDAKGDERLLDAVTGRIPRQRPVSDPERPERVPSPILSSALPGCYPANDTQRVVEITAVNPASWRALLDSNQWPSASETDPPIIPDRPTSPLPSPHAPLRVRPLPRTCPH